MDTLRGTFDSDIPADDSHDWSTEPAAPHEENVREMPPEAIGQDERRMQVRAYNHWVSLLGEATFPSIEELEPHNLTDFGPYSVLLDFSTGIDDPVVQYLGDQLADECGAVDAEAARKIARLSDVPPRSLLSRITDHYMQILANQAPIGFEAEFINQRGSAILYRGILLPFSSDDETIDFIYGVINWKEMADAATADELLLEIDQAIEGSAGCEPEADEDDYEDQPHKHHADALTEWADSPAHEADDLPDTAPRVGVELEEDNIAAFAINQLEDAEDGGQEGGAEYELPTPDFGQFDYDEENEYGEEYEEEDEDEGEGNYSFASLADYIETPVKKAVDLDAERFDPDDYRVEDGGTAPANGTGSDASQPAGRMAEEMAELDEVAAFEGLDDLLDLGAFTSEAFEPEELQPPKTAETVEEAAPVPVAELPADAGLYDCLASARELAESARTSEDRSRQALYAAVGRAYDFSLAAADEPDAYHELIEDSGLTVQDRAPMTPVVKLVFGYDYDKTRLTEYAAVLSHAHRIGIERGGLAGYLGDADGGLKGVVTAERRLRREEAGKEVEAEGDIRAQLAKKLRELEELTLEMLSGEGPEFSLVMLRRDGNGKVALIGEIADDAALTERAAKRLLG